MEHGSPGISVHQAFNSDDAPFIPVLFTRHSNHTRITPTTIELITNTHAEIPRSRSLYDSYPGRWARPFAVINDLSIVLHRRPFSTRVFQEHLSNRLAKHPQRPNPEARHYNLLRRERPCPGPHDAASFFSSFPICVVSFLGMFPHPWVLLFLAAPKGAAYLKFFKVCQNIHTKNGTTTKLMMI
jgi:hypothetical protein